ncbi:hypothetical protein [Neolewinella sp.]|uniref:hypothetical protein n=1 Tax=Neolewinella sp. TaxID=2993543 RepID=UPI003B518491
MQHRYPLLTLLVLLLTVPALAQQSVPPDSPPSASFVATFGGGLVWPTYSSLEQNATGRTGSTGALQLQRRVPLNQQLTFRGGLGVAFYKLAQKANGGHVFCADGLSNCRILPERLIAEANLFYVTVPLGLEVRLGTSGTYLLVNHTLLVNVGANAQARDLPNDVNGLDRPRYAGRIEARGLVQQLGFGLGYSGGPGSNTHLEIGPTFTLGKVLKDTPAVENQFNRNYVRPAGIIGMEARIGLHF